MVHAPILCFVLILLRSLSSSSSSSSSSSPPPAHLTSQFGAVTAARFLSLSIDTIPFSVDPILTSPSSAARSFCEQTSSPSCLHGIHDAGSAFSQISFSLDALYNSRTEFLSHVHQQLTNPPPPTYLAVSDTTSRSFATHHQLEVANILTPQHCNNRPYLVHSRPSCTHPTAPEDLQAIGACPLAAIAAVWPGDIYPPTFTCIDASSVTSDASSVTSDASTVTAPPPVPATTWLLAGHALITGQHYAHATAAYYRCATADTATEGDEVVRATCVASLAQTLGAWGDTDGMMQGYYVALGSQRLMPDVNLAIVVRMVTHVEVIAGERGEIERFRESWLDSTSALTSYMTRAFDLTLFPDLDVRHHWPFHIAKIEDPVTIVGQTLFHLAHQGRNDREFMERLHLLFKTVCSDATMRNYMLDGPPALDPCSHGACGRKKRVGFVSTLLTDHSIGRMMVPILQHLSSPLYAESIEVIVVAPGYGTPDPTDIVVRFATEAVAEVAALPSSLAAARTTIVDLHLDVVIFPDIGMDALTFFLAGCRFAPVQAVWWGHPITTGMDSIDYYLGLDAEVEEAGLDQYSEQLVRMRYINTAPFANNPDGPPVVDELDEFGIVIPEGCEEVNVYMVLGRLFKLVSEFDAALVAILDEDKCGHVVLISEKQTLWNQLVFERGVVGRERISFVAYWNYVRVMAHAKVVLDTFPYGGCLTAQEAMSNGKVVVTYPSEFVRGRFTKNIYEQMGEGEWPIGESVKEFVRLSVRVGRNEGGYRDRVRGMLRERWATVHKQELGVEWGQWVLSVE